MQPHFPLNLAAVFPPHSFHLSTSLLTTFFSVVCAYFILNSLSSPPFYLSLPSSPPSLPPVPLPLPTAAAPCSSLAYLPPLLRYNAQQPSHPSLPPFTPTIPPTPHPQPPPPPPQQLHADLFALTFLCDVSPPFALHTLPLLSLALPASPLPSLPLCLKRHLHRFSQLPLPQQAKQPAFKRKAHRNQAEVDEHVGGKQPQQHSDGSPAAHALLHPHSLPPHTLPPHTLPPLALHTPLFTSSSYMPHVSRPLARWSGDLEGEEGVRVRVAAVVVKCLAGHEEKVVRLVAWQVRRGMGGGAEGWEGEQRDGRGSRGMDASLGSGVDGRGETRSTCAAAAVVVAVCLLSAFPCAPWSPLLRSWVCALQAQLG
ncbi:unnamed protein product [Closterium sp. Naga37s-1]|nr:unnamed protein product [Closterium sp. Naga37s-1]